MKVFIFYLLYFIIKDYTFVSSQYPPVNNSELKLFST